MRPRFITQASLCLAILLVFSPTAVRAMQSFGNYVTCDGDNDTAELQTAIDNAGSRGRAGTSGRVVLSAGVCIIQHTLIVAAVRGLQIEGQGRINTILRWDPAVEANDGPMFSLQRARESLLENFAIQAGVGTSLEWAIDVQNECTDTGPGGRCTSPTDGAHSHRNVFRDLLITRGPGTLGSGIAVRLPDSGTDIVNDQHQFYNVEVNAYTGTGFWIEGRNSKANLFVGCACRAAATDGLSCVTTVSSQENVNHSGAFFWYGGLGVGNRDADFVLGPHNDAVIISGFYSEKSRMLVRQDIREKWEYPITIESVDFESHNVHKWGDNPDGLVVEVSGRGPLVMRGNILGSKDALGQSETPDLSVCFRAVAETAESPGGAFVFEGNAVASTRPNPFAPQDSCRYPTTQKSNIIFSSDFPEGHWGPMPIHITDIEVPSRGIFSVRRLSTSREVYSVSGFNNLHTLEDGIVGQTIRLIGTEARGQTICDASQPCAGQNANIHLALGRNYRLREHDTLTLTIFRDGQWHEVARSLHGRPQP